MIRVEPATLPWLEALADGDEAFTARFGIEVAPGWAEFPEVIPYALDAARAGDDGTWGFHLVFGDDGALVGNGGWKGPPADGAVELGFAVAPSRRGGGIATAFVEELVARARATGDVRVVLAHTLAETSASTTVLGRCGFVRTDEHVDPDDGPVWRWELVL